ncbi:MAG: Sapep family Mn(2+)-dependent dipeptidase, partial [Clostridia bacterium]|nr:Sapep family Mn(2+)-dependent dipeptidase [Clostridia bacterium]
MNEQMNKAIAAMEGDLVKTLQKWIRIPSVKGEPAPGAPFGLETRQALDAALQDAADMGFAVKNYEGYAGDVTLGEGSDEEALGILCHLDVVPAGDGWQVDPFAAEIVGDRMYGRGTSDDKGPAVAALYAMKAVKDAGVPLKRKVKLILGCDEESGWEDMAYYTQHAVMPQQGFSPDASFPVINTEKGLYHLDLNAPAPCQGLNILSFDAGERPNVIPGMAKAVIEGTHAMAAAAVAYGEAMGFDIAAEHKNGVIEITSTGVTGHAAFPEGGKNAIGQLLLTLRELGAQGPIKTLADAVGMEYNGKSLGVKMADETSGPLTCNMGIIRVNQERLYATLDIRYPLLADPGQILKAIQAALPGITVTVDTLKAPHHVPENSTLVQGLLDAYNEETGRPKEAIAIGGG